MWLQGTDHIVIGCECNGATGKGTRTDHQVQYPDDLYRAGMLLAGSTIWVYGSNGEYADAGIKITGTANRLIGGRGDVNAGPGIVIEGTNNSLTNTLVLANSLGADGNYSDIQLGSGAYGTVLDGVTESVNFTSLRPSPATSSTTRWTSRDPGARGRAAVHPQRGAPTAVQVPQDQPAERVAGDPAGLGRQPGRPAAVALLRRRDVLRHQGNQLTVSDGSFWRDLNGVIVGNVLPSERRCSTTRPGWVDRLQRPGPSGVAGVSGWAKFERPRALEITAKGGGAGCAAQSAARSPTSSRATYSLLAYHLGVAQLATLSFSVIWYDASANQVGGPVPRPAMRRPRSTRPRSTQPPVWWPRTAPRQVKLFPTFTRSGMANGERYQITKFCLVPGGNPGDFVEP